MQNTSCTRNCTDSFFYRYTYLRGRWHLIGKDGELIYLSVVDDVWIVAHPYNGIGYSCKTEIWKSFIYWYKKISGKPVMGQYVQFAIICEKIIYIYDSYTRICICLNISGKICKILKIILHGRCWLVHCSYDNPFKWWGLFL